MSAVLEQQLALPIESQASAQGANGITLTAGQQAALDGFTAFLLDPEAKVFVIEGFAGTGKSTLVDTILDRLPKLQQMAKLLDSDYEPYQVQLTATTNKAAENFARITGMDVVTLQSFLGLRVQTDYRTGETSLVETNKLPPEHCVVFADEASYIDSPLLSKCFKRTRNCKFVFMGDPAQLTPVKYDYAPVFQAGFTTAKLTEVMRQTKDNPILELSTKFRQVVETGEFFSFTPDGHHIQHMDRDTFNKAVMAEFTRPDWKYLDSKFLSWTNKRAIDYNHAINDAAKGTPIFQAGDYAICNKFITNQKKSFKTDQLVHIGSVTELEESYEVVGRHYVVDGIRFFMPSSLEEWKKALKRFQAQENWTALQYIEHNWIDLRAAYAQTVNKSQGSTYDRVFIDLDDISRCNNGNQLARLLYVAVSRARHQVFLTGDLA